MPAITGMFLALLLGRFLQRKRSVVPWFSAARLVVIMCYALTGLISLIVPQQYVIPAILSIWAFATIPQTIVAIAFSVVMNAVAGPEGRFELMSHRWSILGATTSFTVLLVGQVLDRLTFPWNYQIVFMALSVGGLISYYFSSHIKLAPVEPPEEGPVHNIRDILRGYTSLVLQDKPFVSFISKRFVYLTGAALAAPLFPLFLVRVIQASDSWISIINTSADNRPDPGLLFMDAPVPPAWYAPRIINHNLRYGSPTLAGRFYRTVLASCHPDGHGWYLSSRFGSGLFRRINAYGAARIFGNFCRFRPEHPIFLQCGLSSHRRLISQLAGDTCRPDYCWHYPVVRVWVIRVSQKMIRKQGENTRPVSDKDKPCKIFRDSTRHMPLAPDHQAQGKSHPIVLKPLHPDEFQGCVSCPVIDPTCVVQ